MSVLRDIPRIRLASLILPPDRSKAGQGYATEAGRAILGYAFTALKKERVISLVHPANRASIRVVERLGGRLVDRIEHLGREMLRYGFDGDTWAAQPSREPLLAAV